MSDEVMDLWDYRQALYCDAAKWVCGDIGKFNKSRWGSPSLDHTWRLIQPGAYIRAAEMADRHAADSVDAYSPGSIAGIGYTLSFGRKKAFYSGNYGGRYGSE